MHSSEPNVHSEKTKFSHLDNYSEIVKWEHIL